MNDYMTRAQIYVTIAEAYYCEPEDRSEGQKDLTGSGICSALFALSGHIKDSYNAIESIMGDSYCFSHQLVFNRRNDLIRADFCTLMSLLTDKEYKEISK